MCTVMAALMGVSTLAQVQAQRQQINAQSMQAEAMAKQAKINADIQARQSEQIADKYAQKQRELSDQLKLAQGQNIASAGASGVSSTTGSAFDVAEASREAYIAASKDMLDSQRNEIFGSHMEEYNLRQQANNYMAQARNVRKGSKLAILGTILSGASSIYGNLQQFKKVPAQAEQKSTVYNPFGATKKMSEFDKLRYMPGYKTDFSDKSRYMPGYKFKN